MSKNCLRKCITHKASTVNTWIGDTQRWYKKSVVSLDTEWYKEKETKVHKIATLQLCVEDMCLIFQMWRMDTLPSSLSNFLMDPNFTFVGVGISQDLGMLREEFNLNCASSKDLALLAKKKWVGKWRQTPGLKTLALLVAGIETEKDKNITLSNWRRTYLSEKQVEYASLDAYASYKIGVGLQYFFHTPESSSSATSTYKSPYDDDYYSSDDDSDY